MAFMVVQIRTIKIGDNKERLYKIGCSKFFRSNGLMKYQTKC